jgi:hypothetical protein
MVITLYDFSRMSEAEQYEAVWKGTFLGDRRKDDSWVQCYSLGNFYVEVFYDQEANRVQRLRSFSKIEQLAPYL